MLSAAIAFVGEAWFTESHCKSFCRIAVTHRELNSTSPVLCLLEGFVAVEMSEEEFSPGVGRISLRRGKKKDGTNWVMFAGGAIAMAVSVAFGRKKIVEEVAEAKETLTAAESERIQASHQEDDASGSLQTFETVPNGTLQWSSPQLALPSTEADFEFRSFKPKRPAPTDPSPPASKIIRQSSVTPQVSKDEVVQSNTQISSAPQSGVIARRSEVVSRLRQQVKSRDAIIYDIQTQLVDQDQMIAMHRNHSVDLQDCVQAISTKLFEANLEIQRLQRELMTQRAKPIVNLDEEFIDYAFSEIRRQWVHPKDVEDIIVKARKLNEEVEHLRREKGAKEKVAQAKSRQCELLSERLSALTIELEEVKSAALGKQRLLEAKEQEYLKLANVVQDLQRKLEIEARDKESQERSMSMEPSIKRPDVRNVELDHNVDRRIIPTTYEEVRSTFAYHPAGNVSKTYGSVPARKGNGGSAARGEPRCLFGAYAKKREASGDQDGRLENLENYVIIDETLILKVEYEVDQLASALAGTSKVVSEKVQDANELERVAKLQDLERQLTKHQAKLAELKFLMAKIIAKFNILNMEDDAFNKEVLQGAAFVFDLERKLAAQEKIAKETSLIIQQLSTSLQLSSSHDPSAQTWRAVQQTSRGSSSHNMHPEHIGTGSSDENPRNSLHKENPLQFLDRQGFPSALRNLYQNRNKNTERQTSSPTKLLGRPHQFQLGAFDSVLASTSRARPSAGSRSQLNSVENQQSQRVSFRPDPETTSGFSFGQYVSEGAEQGDRMSSPEREPHSHRFPAFNPSPKPSVAPALTKWFRPNYSGSEFSMSPSFNSLANSPGYDESRYSPLAQFGSPCFGVGNNEPSSRLSRPLFKSPPTSSDLVCTTNEFRKLNCVISDSEQEFSEDRTGIKRSIGGRKLLSGSNSSIPLSPIGVSPFSARMAQLKVGSLGNFEKGQVLQEDDEDVEWGPAGSSVEERSLFNKDVEALCRGIAKLDAQEGGRPMRESRDSSGSCNQDEPVGLLPTLLRRSNESSNLRH